MRKVPFKTIIGHFWPHVKKYKKSFFFAFLGNATSITISSLLLPLYYKDIIDLISSVSDRALAYDDLMSLLIKLGVAIIIYSAMARITAFALTYSQSNIMRELANYAFKQINKHSYHFFTSTFSGSIVAKTRRFIRAFENIHDILVYDLLNAFIRLIGIFVILMFIIPPLGMLFFVWTAVYISITIYLAKKKIKYDIKEAEADSVVTGKLADVITNILNIKIFSRIKNEFDLFSQSTADEEKKRRQAWYFGNKIDTLKSFLLATLEIVGMYTVIKLWLGGAVSTGTVVLVQIYIVSIFSTLWNIGKIISRLSKSFSETSEIIEIFETEPDILDPEHPEICAINAGNIEFRNVTFKYRDGASVFKDFNFSVKHGEKIGLVGHSGAGKTTITKLLLRFADIQEGEILIDGQNIKNISQDDLRNNIAYVPQEPILFHRSLKANIAYGDPKATYEEIMEAARKARADEFINNLPNKYDTMVGERGVKLSGGQRQRVAIARAMLKKAPILLLDEATSSLDTVSEKYIQEAFDELMKGRTTIVIAHRLSTIQKMDRIVVIENGEIAEQGTHKALLAKKGIYHNLWKHQIDGFME